MKNEYQNPRVKVVVVDALSSVMQTTGSVQQPVEQP
jgi:hypothetical protein